MPFPSLGDLPNPGTEPASLALADGFFTNEPPEKPLSNLKIFRAFAKSPPEKTPRNNWLYSMFLFCCMGGCLFLPHSNLTVTVK